MAVKDEQLRNVLTGEWSVGMKDIPGAEPRHFIYGCCCSTCFAYQQRNQILEMTGEPYVCCAGLMPCFQKPCENKEPWLCLEACCCVNSAILANRYMVQTRFDIQNDPCDDKLLAAMACCACVAMLAQCFADEDTADALTSISDCFTMTVCSCMLSQQQHELDGPITERMQKGYAGPPDFIKELLPPNQLVMVDAEKKDASAQYGATDKDRS